MNRRMPGTPIYSADTNRHPCARQRGFSLVELMMAIVLIAISVALAIPSYQVMADKRLLANGAEQLLGFIEFTRGEAIKRSQVVTLSYARTANDNWCVGAVLGATACDCTETTPGAPTYCAIDSVWTVLDNAQVGDIGLMQAMSGTGQYAFEPIRGRLVEVADLDTNASLLLELQSDNANYKLDLTVSPTGHISLCSKDVLHKVPGYKVCPA